MTSLSPRPVPQAEVRRRQVTEPAPTPVQQVTVGRVPAPVVVPRQIDPVGLRLLALQLENDALRAEVDRLRSA